jgi:hypothetical protein
VPDAWPFLNPEGINRTRSYNPNVPVTMETHRFPATFFAVLKTISLAQRYSDCVREELSSGLGLVTVYGAARDCFHYVQSLQMDHCAPLSPSELTMKTFLGRGRLFAKLPSVPSALRVHRDERKVLWY